MSKFIYAYSKASYLSDQFKELHDDNIWLKVGETQQESVDQRIQQQDGTSDAEPLLKQFESGPVDFSDKKLHKFLKEDCGIAPVREDKNREWFEFESVEHFKRLFNEYRHGVCAAKSYDMRPPQREACDKIASAFEDGYEEFLLAAKMRFGKNFTLLNFIKEDHEASSRSKTRVLFTTYKPNVFDSLKDDVEDHVLFDDFEIVDLRKKKTGNIPETDAAVEIVVASAQYIMVNSGDRWYRMYENQDFDFLVVDEAHYGTLTENFREAILDATNFDYGKTVWMTGTPFRFSRMRGFDDDNAFHFTYIDEQRLKQQGEPWIQDMPTFEMHHVNIDDRIVENQDRFYDEKERFRFMKLLATDDAGEFVNEAAVRAFFRQLLGHVGRREETSPFFIADRMDHSLWMLPNRVDVVKAAASMLRDLVQSGTRVFVAAGEGTDNEGQSVLSTDQIHRLKEAINRSTVSQTIVLTCGRFREGTTVEEWNSVLMLDDGESAEGYFQTMFRAGSPSGDDQKTKDTAYVFDFNPERSLKVIFDATEAQADIQEDQNQTEIIRELLTFCPIFGHSGASFEGKVTADDVFANFDRNGKMANRFGSFDMMQPEATFDENLVSILSNVDSEVEKLVVSVNENGTDGGKTYDVQNASSNSGSSESIQRLIRAVRNFLKRIPTYLVATDIQETSVSDILDHGNPALFEEATGVTLDGFSEIVHSGVIDVSRLNRRIKSALAHEKRMEKKAAEQLPWL